MKKDRVNSWAKRVVLSLAAALIWMLSGALIAPARSPGLADVSKAPGQGNVKTTRKQVPRGVPALTGINPKSAPPGGVGELVLTGRNFFQGMALAISGLQIQSLKVESPERAVATIAVPFDTQEERCDLTLQYWLTANGEISPSPLGTPEVGQIASSVSFTISNSSPMPALLGEYTLFPEEEITLMNSQAASAQQMAANQPSKDQREQMKKQQAEMKEMRDKYKRGEITQAEYMAYTMKVASGMMPQVSPQQMAAAGQTGQTGLKLLELQKQEKKGELRLKQGSISFLAGGNALFTEPLSGLKEITVLPPPAGQKASIGFQVAFNDGKKYFFRSESRPENDVSKLKKRLGK